MNQTSRINTTHVFFTRLFAVAALVAYFAYAFYSADSLAFGKNKNTTVSNMAAQQTGAGPASVFAEQLKPIYFAANRLKADSINLNIELVEVGVAGDGSLETPHDWSKGGWYKDGPKPGEEGNMIINAHYDDNYGRPAAFWQLKNLKVDDKVVVEDKQSKSFEYKVVSTYLVDINDPNRLDILKNHEPGKATMTLITCGGIWLPGKSTYTKRFVVKAELIVRGR
jgi:LPXTG-site transpeptidase (sortase) family protein